MHQRIHSIYKLNLLTTYCFTLRYLFNCYSNQNVLRRFISMANTRNLEQVTLSGILLEAFMSSGIAVSCDSGDWFQFLALSIVTAPPAYSDLESSFITSASMSSNSGDGVISSSSSCCGGGGDRRFSMKFAGRS